MPWPPMVSERSKGITQWLQKNRYEVAKCRFYGFCSFPQTNQLRDLATELSKIFLWIAPTNPRALSIRANDGSFTIRQIP